ncbi:hypothetical protein ACPWUF_05460 [Bisgaard Taxon 46]
MAMLKKATYLLGLCLLSSFTANATPLEEKQRVLADLQSSREYMERIANSDSLTPIEFVPQQPQKAFDPTDKRNFVALSNQTKIDIKQLQQFFAQKQPTLIFKEPYYFLNIPKESAKLVALLGLEMDYFVRNPQLHPVFTPTNIEFTDGTQESHFEYFSPIKIFEDKNLDGELFEHHLSEIEQAVYATKDSDYTQIALGAYNPVKRVSFTVELPLTQYKSHLIQDVPTTIQTEQGDIKLTHIIGNAVIYRLPTEMVENVIVQGVYQDGRALANIGSKTAPLLTTSEKSYHRQLANLFKEVHHQVTEGKIKAEESAIRQFFQTRQPPLPEVDEKKRYTQVTRYYTGDVSQVVFQIPEKTEKQKFDVVYSVAQGQ